MIVIIWCHGGNIRLVDSVVEGNCPWGLDAFAAFGLDGIHILLLDDAFVDEVGVGIAIRCCMN